MLITYDTYINNKEDLEYIRLKIRNDFDNLDKYGTLLHAERLIKLAERFGFADLVLEMRSDLNVAA